MFLQFWQLLITQALQDGFVCSLANTSFQKCLLTERNLTLERVLSIATAMEMVILESQGSKEASLRENLKAFNSFKQMKP